MFLGCYLVPYAWTSSPAAITSMEMFLSMTDSTHLSLDWPCQRHSTASDLNTHSGFRVNSKCS